ncbi:MAG: DNA primase [Chloroflexia bacterium]
MPDNDVIADIKHRIAIEDVVGEKVRLARAGRNLKGLCPFHSEKTPSFVVYPNDGSYHCFGCGAGGDAFSFLMKTDGLDFRGALETLARRTGVELKPRDESDVAADRARERLKEACAAAAAYYHNLFRNNPAANKARAYAEKRGLTASTIETFQVGFAPDSWDALGNYLKERGYTPQEMVDAGLVAERDEGGHYDRFRNRLLFPIRDQKGATVGFGARALDEGQVPKYLNSPQSAVFDKSSILYGFDLARPHIQRAGQAVIVEGYMDVVVAHQAGQSNVVGTIGTALTDRHAELLKRIARHIVLCLDPDTAGDMAALKGSEVLQEHAEKIAIPIRGEHGMMGVERRSQIEIKVMQLPRGTDPDELLLADGGPQRWNELRDAALPLIDHVIGVAASKYDIKTARGKSDAVQELSLFVRELGDPIQRAHYIQRIASVLRTPEEAVQEAVTRARRGAADKGRAQSERQRTPAGTGSPASEARPPSPMFAGLPEALDPATAAEEHLLTLVLNYPQVTWMVGAPVPEDFTRLENRLIYETLTAAAVTADKSELDVETVRTATREELDPALGGHFDRLLNRSQEPELYRFALPYELGERIKRLRQHNDRMLLQQCQQMMQEAQETGDAETINKLLPFWSLLLSRFPHYDPKPSTVFRDSRD